MQRRRGWSKGGERGEHQESVQRPIAVRLEIQAHTKQAVRMEAGRV